MDHSDALVIHVCDAMVTLMFYATKGLVHKEKFP